MALAHHRESKERWFVVSDEPTSTQTFVEYGWRFDIEEGFLDDKSNGFELESSQLGSAKMLSRLCLVLAIATLYLSAVGTEVVATGYRRWVDPHWFRGSSYLKIGWRWIRPTLVWGWQVPDTLELICYLHPDPAIASHKQALKRNKPLKFRSATIDGSHTPTHATRTMKFQAS
jgi:hypothetical protein